MLSSEYINTVSKTPEFLRIANLPRRNWENNISEKITVLTDLLKTPIGTMELWPNQAAALLECYQCDGLFAPIPVGQGKALISLLIPVILEAKNPVLIVPASLRNQTNDQVIPKMREHWKLHSNLTIIGYSELSQLDNKNILDVVNPDVIVLDEAHYLKNLRSARSKRFFRYLKKNNNVKIAALSGTMTQQSIMDYWHILITTLGEKNAPLPNRYNEAKTWANALDSQRNHTKIKTNPGILRTLCKNVFESPRKGYHKRLAETPGVIAYGQKEIGTSLYINNLELNIPPKIEKVLDDLRKKWIMPDGEELLFIVDFWRRARELALGFYYKWDPQPSKEFLKIRSDWKKFVRYVINHNRLNLDSELAVFRYYKGTPQREAWKNARKKLHTKAEWIDTFAVKTVADWCKKNVGICWVEHLAFGEAINNLYSIPFYKATDNIIFSGKSIISSMAHSTGKNLQEFSKNLVVSPYASNKKWEQLLGRTHRYGQKEDTVKVDVFSYVKEHKESIKKALLDAKYVYETMGTKQKLLYANLEKGLVS